MKADIEELRYRVEELEWQVAELQGCQFRPPVKGLTLAMTRGLNLLAKKAPLSVTRNAMVIAVVEKPLDVECAENVVRAQMSRARGALKPHGITIHSKKDQGYWLTEEDAALWEKLMTEENGPDWRSVK